MDDQARQERWLASLAVTLAEAAELVARGPEAYATDPALPLAFEALSDRVGEIAKRLIAIDPQRFSHPIWKQAARHRDFVVHHYDQIDRQALWATVTTGFPELRHLIDVLNDE